MDKPKVSIIIPVYNVEGLLPRCIDTLLAQTLEGMELIFVDDCSMDGSKAILDAYAKEHPDTLRVLQTPRNMKQGAARNLGMREARSDLIGFVDSDDFVAPTMFERLYERATETGADITTVQYARVSETTTVDEAVKADLAPLVKWSPNLTRWDNKELDDEGVTDSIAYPRGGVYCSLWTRDLLDRASVDFPEEIFWEDNFWSALVIAHACKTAFVPSVEYFYTMRGGSTTAGVTYERAMQRREIENRLLEEAKSRNLLDSYHDAWEYLYTFRYAINTTGFLLALREGYFDDIAAIRDDLNREFPTWRSNRYYRETYSTTKRLKASLKLNHPKLWTGMRRLAGRH